MTVAYIGIGSNAGDRAAFCRAAVRELEQTPRVEVDARSSLYETSPVGGPPQRSFMNAVVRVVTDLDALELLGTLKEIERRLGRDPGGIRWGPRVVDLDLLEFGSAKLSEPGLEVPHPLMTQRRFVLVPLLEIDPEAADPWGRPYADFVDEAEGQVELYAPM